MSERRPDIVAARPNLFRGMLGWVAGSVRSRSGQFVLGRSLNITAPDRGMYVTILLRHRQ